MRSPAASATGSSRGIRRANSASGSPVSILLVSISFINITPEKLRLSPKTQAALLACARPDFVRSPPVRSRVRARSTPTGSARPACWQLKLKYRNHENSHAPAQVFFDQRVELGEIERLQQVLVT